MPGTIRIAKPCGCLQESWMGQKREPLCEHRNVFVKEQSEEQPQPRPRRRSTLKRGRGFQASSSQQKKVKDLACIVCGKDRFEAKIEAAHVYPRRLTPCDCPEGVVPLCSECHKFYDDQNQNFDLLPALLTHGYRKELVHAIVAHEVSLFHLLEQVTGTKWVPAEEMVV